MNYSEKILKKINALQNNSGTLSKNAKELINSHYDKLLVSYGQDDTRAVHWENELNQKLRWKVLCEISHLSNSSVLDFGCGYGDLSEFLKEEFEGFSYTGIDINPQSISIAKLRYPTLAFSDSQIQNTRFSADWILASGAFGYAIPNYKEEYSQMIENLFWRATKGLSINLLTLETKRNDHYAVFTLGEIMDIAKNLTSKFNIRSDYLENDVTLHLLH
jgi:trans-aconitate methyltransferase